MAAARTRTVQNIIERPGTGRPFVGHKVTIRLNTAGFIDGGTREKIKETYAVTDSTGLWSAVLEVNDDVEPGGSYYTVRELPGLVWSFVVTPGDVALNLYDCLTSAPQDGPLPVLGVAFSDNGDGTVTMLAWSSTVLTDNGDGTASLVA
jgi:hypothetical protein